MKRSGETVQTIANGIAVARASAEKGLRPKPNG